jgi:hypothetical protein
MWRAVAVLLIGLAGLTGCGGVGVTANFNAGQAAIATGSVTLVQFTAIEDPGGTTLNVTVVTLAQPGIADRLTFCGNVANAFPMDAFVRVRFIPVSTCVSTFSVTITG